MRHMLVGSLRCSAGLACRGEGGSQRLKVRTGAGYRPCADISLCGSTSVCVCGQGHAGPFSGPESHRTPTHLWPLLVKSTAGAWGNAGGLQTRRRTTGAVNTQQEVSRISIAPKGIWTPTPKPWSWFAGLEGRSRGFHADLQVQGRHQHIPGRGGCEGAAPWVILGSSRSCGAFQDEHRADRGGWGGRRRGERHRR